MITILNYLSAVFWGIFTGALLAFCFVKFIYQSIISTKWKSLREITFSVLYIVCGFIFTALALMVAGMFLGIFYGLCYQDLVARGEMSVGLIITFGLSAVLGIIITWRSREKMLED